MNTNSISVVLILLVDDTIVITVVLPRDKWLFSFTKHASSFPLKFKVFCPDDSFQCSGI